MTLSYAVSLTPSVFLLRLDLCRVAASSFCSLDTTGPLVVSSATLLFSRPPDCCGKNSSLDGCLVSPSYVPILMATLPPGCLESWALLVGETDDGVFASSATGLVAASLPPAILPPAPMWRGLPVDDGLVTGKYVGGGFGTVLGVSFSLNDSMLCISTASSLLRFLDGSGSGGGAGGGTAEPAIVVAAAVPVGVSLSTLFSCSWNYSNVKWFVAFTLSEIFS